MSMSRRRKTKREVATWITPECEGDGNCIRKKRITFVVRLKMLDSPKSKLQWYWGGREGVSLTPSSALVRDSDQGIGKRPSISSNA